MFLKLTVLSAEVVQMTYQEHHIVGTMSRPIVIAAGYRTARGVFDHFYLFKEYYMLLEITF